MRWRAVMAGVAAVLMLGGCGDDGGDPFAPTAGGGDDVGDRIAGVDPCSLITDDEMLTVMGRPLVGETREPNGGFISCSWNTGDVILTIAAQPEIVLAPGDDECPAGDIGEESFICPGSVKFWTDGVHASVSTISNTETAQLTELARLVPPRLAG